MLRITQTTVSGQNVNVTFPSVLERNYTFESSPDLVAWTTVPGAPVPGTGNAILVQLGPFPGATKLFVPVRVGP